MTDDLSPATQAAVDLKMKVQKLSLLKGFEGLGEHIQRAIEVQLWGVLHEVMRDGIEVGRLHEREDVVTWLRASEDWACDEADIIEKCRHLPTPHEGPMEL